MGKLWGGRFSEDPDRDFEAFNASFPFDYRLLEHDVKCAQAHLEALREAGVIEAFEAEQIDSALGGILEEAESAPGYVEEAIRGGLEDVHSFVESEVFRRAGDVAYKLNTGRSRNDQVATDLRLYVRAALDNVQQLIRDLQRTILETAEATQGVPLPGYTHSQRAQPVLFAHYLLAYFEMLRRDGERLDDARRRLNVSPLGSAALAGSGYPLNRELQARLLGFEGVSRNSMDAVSDRDFIVEFQSAATLIMIHLSRLAEDLILYSTAEFGFVEFSDKVTTGSSLLPQKKNPDALELIRGKTGRVLGNHLSLLTVLKGLPMTYNKDLQEDKEPLFDTVSTVVGCLRLMRTVILNMEVKEERLLAAVSTHFMNATELADYLVSRGATFRQAHGLVGKVVVHSLGRGLELAALPLEDYQSFSPLFQEDLYDRISLDSVLATKSLQGGTSPDRVREALAEARRFLDFR